MNMSYCRFQNTEIDLRECVSELEYVDDLESLELSDDEARAMKRMYTLCINYVHEYERLNDIDQDIAG
jgi:hypothetical protein